MRLKENIFIYFSIAVLMYLIDTMNTELFLKLVEYSVISIIIGKSIEFFSYFVSEKLKFNLVTATIFSLTVLYVVLLILKLLGYVDTVLLVYIVSGVITIWMTVYSYNKEKKYNQKLEEAKRKLSEDDFDEDN